jgi:hypothetical protein
MLRQAQHYEEKDKSEELNNPEYEKGNYRKVISAGKRTIC